MIKKVTDQIYQYINHRHPDNIGLDHRIIPHGNRIDCQFPYTVPHKNTFNDRGSSQQTANGQSHQSNNRQHRRFQYTLPENHARPDAPCAGSHDIILIQFFQNRCAHLPHIFGRHGNGQCQRWKQRALHGISAGNDRKQLPVNGKYLHQKQRHKKIRHRIARKAEKTQKIICKLIMAHRSQNPQWNREHNRCAHR